MQGNARRKHPIAPEVHHKHRKHDHHAAKRRRDDNVKDMRGFLQFAGVVEVHTEDTGNIGAEPEAATQDRQYGVCDKQFVAGGVQPQVQLFG